MQMFISSILFLFFYNSVLCLPDKGKWLYSVSEEENGLITVSRTLFKNSEIFIRISCEPFSRNVYIDGILIDSSCWVDYKNKEDGLLEKLQQSTVLDEFQRNNLLEIYIKFPKKLYSCSSEILLNGTRISTFPDTNLGNKTISQHHNDEQISDSLDTTVINHPFIIMQDGFYRLILRIKSIKNAFNATVHIEMKGPHGYLSAVEWPLLPFYEFMCIVYVVFAFFWLVVSFLQWRDLLRIQFWIEAVILIGMIEKALFYEEYQSINSAGESSFFGSIFVAELVSAAKRTLARILVIIVSLGYGIVKPRLGSHLPKIIGVGTVYFILASIEAYLRVMRPKNDLSNSLLIASIPLALLDSFICWWIFSSLTQTTRTLRLRRNVVKLALYNRFTNALKFAVIASTIFMLYSIKVRQTGTCLTDWKKLWMDDAYWHLLFSVILFVIMILWRPTNNNQRYAFSPLLDVPDDEDEDREKIEHFVNDSYGIKIRGMGSNRSDSPKSRSNMDEDLKWVEEHIPSSFIDSSLPILDSDEELMNTKFEISKME